MGNNGKRNMGKIHGKNSNGGKRGACSMGKLKYFFFPGTYTRSALELDRAWRATMLRMKKKNHGKKTWKNWRKLGIGGKKLWEKWEK